ncbi:MAG: YabP/YqfC family sporulation protein [Oscillospiraceae bacterium]
MAHKGRAKNEGNPKKDAIKNVLKPIGPHIEANGNKEFIVEGCKGILEYEENVIKINAGSIVISFLGSDMEIKNYCDDETVIVGNIVSIEFTS